MKWKYYIPTSFTIGRNKIIALIAFTWLSIAVALVSGMPSPDAYKDGQCELVAKDYQREFGGSLIFIQPLKDNGAYDFGDYNGHFLNRVYSKDRGIYYIDWMSQEYFSSESEVMEWYEWNTGKNAELFDLSRRRPPFAIYWHY